MQLRLLPTCAIWIDVMDRSVLWGRPDLMQHAAQAQTHSTIMLSAQRFARVCWGRSLLTVRLAYVLLPPEPPGRGVLVRPVGRGRACVDPSRGPPPFPTHVHVHVGMLPRVCVLYRPQLFNRNKPFFRELTEMNLICHRSWSCHLMSITIESSTTHANVVLRSMR